MLINAIESQAIKVTFLRSNQRTCLELLLGALLRLRKMAISKLGSTVMLQQNIAQLPKELTLSRCKPKFTEQPTDSPVSSKLRVLVACRWTLRLRRGLLRERGRRTSS